MRDLDATLPPSTVVAGTGAMSELPVAIEPGDFLLGQAHGLRHAMIKRGQEMRIAGADRCYAGYTHAALVVSAKGDLIEAVGEGVRESSLLQYVVDREVFQVVHIESSPQDRAQIVAFAREVLAARAPYGSLATLSVLLWAATRSRLTFFLDGSFTCSGLVATALERTSTHFGTNPARMMPAQLAVLFGAPPPPPEQPRARPAGRRWLRRG